MQRFALRPREPGVRAEPEGEPQLERVRMFDQSRKRCLQAGENFLAFNLVRQGADYPGFSPLLKEALLHLRTYEDCFRPQHVRDAALHYVDAIDIRFPPTGPLNAEDYFKLGVTVPKTEDWQILKSATEIIIDLVRHTGHPDHLVVALHISPDETNAKGEKVRINWHAVCRELNTLDAAVLTGRLSQVRNVIWRFLQDSVTERLWKTFEPASGD